MATDDPHLENHRFLNQFFAAAIVYSLCNMINHQSRHWAMDMAIIFDLMALMLYLLSFIPGFYNGEHYLKATGDLDFESKRKIYRKRQDYWDKMNIHLIVGMAILMMASLVLFAIGARL